MDKYIQKVEQLLAKAASTDSEDEATALISKAQQLMTKYSIEEAMLNATRTVKATPGARVIRFAEKGQLGARELSVLMCGVALTNDLKPLLYGPQGEFQRVILFGYEHDINMAEMMYNALYSQLQLSEIRSRKLKPEGIHGRTWKVSFYQGFVNRLHDRLQEAQRAATQETPGSDLVLRSKKQEVDQFVEDLQLETKKNTPKEKKYSLIGMIAGTAAANEVDLNDSNKLSSAGSNSAALSN